MPKRASIAFSSNGLTGMILVFQGEASASKLGSPIYVATMATDPALLFCDEPTSGLDPTTAMDIDQLLLEVNRFLGITILVVTHEVMTLENIATRCIMLDEEAKGIIASGSLEGLQHSSEDPRVQTFFRRRISTDRFTAGL